MMRSILPPLTILLCAGVDAQPTIHAADRLPPAGTSRTLNTRNLVDDPPAGGENVIWDYSWLIAQGTAQANYEVANDPDYPEATLTIESGGQLRYLSVTDEGYLDHGYYTPPTPECTMVFDNTKELLPPMMTYGDEFIDDYSGFCDEQQLTEEGTYEVIADGWGTLIMPLNTWTNVLRVASVRNFTFGPTVFREEIFDYYGEGLPEPVITTSRLFLVIGGQEVQYLYSANYIDEVGLGVRQNRRVDFGVFPNPAQDHVRVTLSENLQKGARIELLDATGRIALSAPVLQASTGTTIDLDISEIPPGCYTFRTVNGQGVAHAGRLVKD